MADGSSYSWKRITAIFNDLVDDDADSRAATLSKLQLPPAVRRDVEALLASHDALKKTSRFETGIPAGVSAPTARHLSEGDRFAGCVVVRVLGTGGMGSVYLAKQLVPSRDVALKIIRNDRMTNATISRFQRESQILAKLKHPAIAPVIAVGFDSTPDGVEHPYMLMEYVEGQSLSEVIADNALEPRRKIELLAEVCEGIHAAHQMRVIHRDIKPGNILIDKDGRPKIVDFGIARIDDDLAGDATFETGAGEILGTLAYISPEQLTLPSGEQDTRADIYSLAVIGYELLMGERPYDVSGRPISDAISTITSGQDASKSLNRVRATDLRSILAKAMATDRSDRYASAKELADDLRRYLVGDAVTALPSSLGYQLRVIARRNKAATAAAAVSLVALILATAISLSFAVRAERANTKAQHEARRLKRVNEFFLHDIFDAAYPEDAEGRDMTVREMVDLAAANVDRMEPVDLRADIHFSIAGIYSSLGTPEAAGGSLLMKAAEHAEEALRLRESILDNDDPAIADALLMVADCLMSFDRHEEALAHHQRALAILSRQTPQDAVAIVDATLSLATNHYFLRQMNDTEAIARDALGLLRRSKVDHPMGAANAHIFLGDAAAHRDRLDRAEAHYRKAVEFAEGFRQDRPLLHADMIEKLGGAYVSMRRDDDGLRLLLQAHQTRKRFLPEGHLQLVKSALAPLPLLHRTGKYDEVLNITESAKRIYTATYGKTVHAYIGHCLVWRGRALQGSGRSEEALVEYSNAIAAYEAASSPNHQFIAGALIYRGFTHLDVEDCDAAKADAAAAAAQHSKVDEVSADKQRKLADLWEQIGEACG